MRVDPELTYQDYKDGVCDAFRMLGNKGWEKAKKLQTIWLMKMTIY
jgi:hypothetical protein